MPPLLSHPQVRSLIHQLLVKIGRHHPQALMYPLLVACKSASPSRRAAAYSVLEQLRQHSAVLVEQAQLVSQELIRWGCCNETLLRGDPTPRTCTTHPLTRCNTLSP